MPVEKTFFFLFFFLLDRDWLRIHKTPIKWSTSLSLSDSAAKAKQTSKKESIHFHESLPFNQP